MFLENRRMLEAPKMAGKQSIADNPRGMSTDRLSKRLEVRRRTELELREAALRLAHKAAISSIDLANMSEEVSRPIHGRRGGLESWSTRPTRARHGTMLAAGSYG